VQTLRFHREPRRAPPTRPGRCWSRVVARSARHRRSGCGTGAASSADSGRRIRHASTPTQIRRAARYFAISSKKSMCALKKKLNRGAKSSIASPARTADSTYAKPLANVNCELLSRRGARLADVVAGDRHGVARGQLRGTRTGSCRSRAASRASAGKDEILCALVLLENVVLDRSAQPLTRDAGLVADRDVHRQQRRSARS